MGKITISLSSDTSNFLQDQAWSKKLSLRQMTQLQKAFMAIRELEYLEFIDDAAVKYAKQQLGKWIVQEINRGKQDAGCEFPDF